MDKAERQYLRALIESRIHQLHALLEINNKSPDQEEPSQGDTDTRLDSMTSSMLQKKMINDTEIELNRLNANLEWLQSDEAGLCASCGCVIASARLKVLPATRLCIACAERQAEHI